MDIKSLEINTLNWINPKDKLPEVDYVYLIIFRGEEDNCVGMASAKHEMKWDSKTKKHVANTEKTIFRSLYEPTRIRGPRIGGNTGRRGELRSGIEASRVLYYCKINDLPFPVEFPKKCTCNEDN